jgi:hypothetical protein
MPKPKSWEYYFPSFPLFQIVPFLLRRKAPLHEWSRAILNGTLPSNLVSEALNNVIKKKCKPHHRFDQCIHGLKTVEQEYNDKYTFSNAKMRNLKPSQAQKNFLKCHPKPSIIERYRVQEIAPGRFSIHKHHQLPEAGYMVSPNPFRVCSIERCRVHCRKCGGDRSPCCHSLICECQNFAYRGYCHHVHIVILHEFSAGGVSQQPERPHPVALQSNTDDALSDVHILYGDEEIANVEAVHDDVANVDEVNDDEDTDDALSEVPFPFGDEDIANVDAVHDVVANVDEVNEAEEIEEIFSNDPIQDNNCREEEPDKTRPNPQRADDEFYDCLDEHEPERPIGDGDHGQMARNIKEDCTNERHKVKEQISTLLRKVDRTDDSTTSLEILKNLKSKLRLITVIADKATPMKTRRRTHIKVERSPFPRKNKRKICRPVPPTDFHMKEILKMAFLSSDANDPNWPAILSLKVGIIENYICSQTSPEVQIIMRNLLKQAKKSWECNICNSFEREKFQSGYIKCGNQNCDNWYHLNCAIIGVIIAAFYH